MNQDLVEDTLYRINLQPTKEKRLSSEISHLRKASRYMLVLVGLLSAVIFSSCATEADIILAAHNQYRSAVGVPALVWSTNLASSAQAWADHLATIHQLVHSGAGENLWRGTKGAYTGTQKVDSWGAEKQYFLVGKPFPNVSSTGNWQDVGHYTQIIWSSTTSVGCGQASDSSFDYLVCQYSPPGNVIGQYPLGHP